MNPDHFVKVFDVVDAGFRDWTFPAFGLIFVAIGVVIAAFPAILRAMNIPSLDFQTGFRRIFRYGFLAFAILWAILAFWTTFPQHLRHKALAEKNQCRVVEGPVENFVPMPFGGHAVESFSVAGVSFKYSDFIVTDGFNNTSSHGGPINRDSYVRICYDPAGNAILRLEIMDFKGEAKDYSRAQGIFPSAEDVGRISTNTSSQMPGIPRHGEPFIFLLLLDFILIPMTWLPYYRTFFPIKTVSGWNRAVPVSLQPEEKIKLRNSLIYWDRPNQTIWLRPRGFNVIQVPSTIARLNIDAADRSITGGEIRFSSGATLGYVAVLWIVYELFTSVSFQKGMTGVPPGVLLFFG
ncbi:MAG: hypothetical protein JO141_16245, partial [Bradyrhizobium sp.]|nr:hypothetical protein [Bradyrhizobium sp.]